MKIFNKQFMKKMYYGLPLLLLAVILSACSSSDDGAVSETPVTYSGSVAPAALGDTTSGPLAIDAFTGGDTGETFALSMTDGGTDTVTNPRTLALTKIFKNIAQHIDTTNNNTETNTSKLLAPIADTIPSPCGTGSATITGTADTDSYTFSATVSFAAYCEDNVVITGIVAMSGEVYNYYPYDIKRYTMSFNNIFVSEGGVSYNAGGSITLDNDTNTVTVSMVVLDNATGKTYWTKDYTMTVDDTGSPISIVFSGEYYDHDEGFVSAQTTSDILVDSGAACPHAGEIEIVGSNGTATLTVTGLCTYSLVVDYTDPLATDHSETGTTWQ